MKTSRIAAAAALVFSATLTCSATVPTWTQFSYGYYRTGGPPQIEYWIDAYDADNNLTGLLTYGWFEVYNHWEPYGSTGNSSHRQADGWCSTYDGYSPVKIIITDTTGTYNYETEVNF